MNTFSLLMEQLNKDNINIQTFVLYHGGEPFLNKDFFTFAAEIRARFPKSFIKTVSNGSLFSSDLVQRIANSALDLIQISIDSTSFKQSDLIRRGSNSQEVALWVNTLMKEIKSQRSKLSVEISSTQFLDQRNSDLDPFTDLPDASWLNDFFGEDMVLRTVWAMQWPRMELDDSYEVVTRRDPAINGPYKNSCKHLEDTITVRSDGTVVPCCYDLLSDLNMGSIHQKSILDIWKSTTYEKLRMDVKNMNPCKTCSACNTIRRDKTFLCRSQSQ